MAGSGFTLDSISSSLGASLGTFESNLQTALANTNPTATDLIALQKDVAEYTLFLSTNSTIMKSFSDELKAIIQKVG